MKLRLGFGLPDTILLAQLSIDRPYLLRCRAIIIINDWEAGFECMIHFVGEIVIWCPGGSKNCSVYIITNTLSDAVPYQALQLNIHSILLLWLIRSAQKWIGHTISHCSPDYVLSHAVRKHSFFGLLSLCALGYTKTRTDQSTVQAQLLLSHPYHDDEIRQLMDLSIEILHLVIGSTIPQCQYLVQQVLHICTCN